MASIKVWINNITYRVPVNVLSCPGYRRSPKGWVKATGLHCRRSHLDEKLKLLTLTQPSRWRMKVRLWRCLHQSEALQCFTGSDLIRLAGIYSDRWSQISRSFFFFLSALSQIDGCDKSQDLWNTPPDKPTYHQPAQREIIFHPAFLWMSRCFSCWSLWSRLRELIDTTASVFRREWCVCLRVWLCARVASSICHPSHGLWWHLVVKPTVWDAGIDRANGRRASKMEWVRRAKRDWGARRAPATQGSLTCHAFWALRNLFWDCGRSCLIPSCLIDDCENICRVVFAWKMSSMLPFQPTLHHTKALGCKLLNSVCHNFQLYIIFSRESGVENKWISLILHVLLVLRLNHIGSILY